MAATSVGGKEQERQGQQSHLMFAPSGRPFHSSERIAHVLNGYCHFPNRTAELDTFK